MIFLKEEMKKVSSTAFAELMSQYGGRDIIVSNPYGGSLGFATRNDRSGRNRFIDWWNEVMETDALYFTDHGDGYYTAGPSPDSDNWVEINLV